ncbi:unnamed protein product, partial [Ixodes hexagonus]
MFAKPSVLVQPQKNCLRSKENGEEADESTVLQNANNKKVGNAFFLFGFTWRQDIASRLGPTNRNNVTSSLHPTTTDFPKSIKSVLGHITEKGHWLLQSKRKRNII